MSQEMIEASTPGCLLLRRGVPDAAKEGAHLVSYQQKQQYDSPDQQQEPSTKDPFQANDERIDEPTL